MSLLPGAPGPQNPTWSPEENSNKMKESDTKAVMGEEVEEEMVSSASLEPSTLQWPGDRERDGEKNKENRDIVRNRESVGGVEERKGDGSEGERRSLRSECVSLRGAESRTESERELRAGAEKRRRGDGWLQMEREPEEPGMRRRGEKELEEENLLPDKAAQVFSPAVTILHSASLPASPRETDAFWDMETEKSPFLGPHEPSEVDYYHDWPLEGGGSKCGCGFASREVLKVGVSLLTAALIFPFLVWGGFVFLPFDAPLLDSAPLRLVYTLRCSVFASVPIILGWLVLGVSRLRTGKVTPLFGGEEGGGGPEVSIHWRFVTDSASLFLLYFLQLVVMAMYLSQEQLKLVPLLTIVFALGRLVYWLAAALGSSVRGFGFGLSFLPCLAMLTANLYFIFTIEAAGSIYLQEGASVPEPHPATRQRFWG
ncbi:transmembrane protein 79 isoform 2-T2 [Polymixia lowei]